MSVAILENKHIGNLTHSIAPYLGMVSQESKDRLKRLFVILFIANHNCFVTKYQDGELIQDIKVMKPKKTYGIQQCMLTLQSLRYNIETSFLKYNIEKELILLDGIIKVLGGVSLNSKPEKEAAPDWFMPWNNRWNNTEWK